MRSVKIISGAIAGAAAGYLTATLIAPRSGKQTLKNIDTSLSKPVKDIRMTLNKVAYKLGIISEKKKAELNKNTIEAYNANRKMANDKFMHPEDHHAKENVNDTSAANKAVMNSTAKSALSKVPVNAK
ncbi:hypothetical protein LVD15_21820 [Fulvivirga maritima]|uniref:hypothetical protein n=1 Tax=Fulvivirga maritima TaxID=2904247 RepID=UPI001F47D2B9|nr:hypothetical protein [Fulvivirga maritima]UII25911.1 hypothetical protein LVD15_21820 [Fulvivirga maritima]